MESNLPLTLKMLNINYEYFEKIANESKPKYSDIFKVGNMCDAMDETKNFCVGEINENNGDQYKIHFEGWSNKHDITISPSKPRKLDHFRRNTKGYTGQKMTAFRILSFQKDEFVNFKNMIKEIKEIFFSENLNEKNFNSNYHKNFLDYFNDASTITQILRGKIFFKLDYFMTNPFNNINANEILQEMIEIIYYYLDFIKGYLRIFKDQIFVTEIIKKFPDLFIVEKLCAIQASYYEILLTLKRIFGKDERVCYFYKTHNEYLKECKFREVNKKICKKKFYVTNLQSQMNVKDKIATFAITNFIDYFNEIEGFKLLFNIILDLNDSILPNNKSFYIPLEMVQYFLELLDNLNTFVNVREYFGKEIEAIKENIWQRISNLSEIEIKEVEKNIIEKITRHLKSILDSEDKTLLFDEINLHFHLKCFTSKNLPKRIKGITEINNIIQKVESKGNNHLGSNDQRDYYEDYKIDNNGLFNWIKKNNFFEIFFGENMHEEMLKRCIPVLNLYCKNNLIEKKTIDILWRFSIEKHEAISQQIQNILIEISKVLKKSERDYIYSKIMKIPKSKFDIETLNFAKIFIRNCIVLQNIEKNNKSNSDRFENSNSDNRLNDYGVNLFIKLSMDEFNGDKNDISTVQASIDHLKDLFNKIEFNDDMINDIFFDLIENIKKGNSIIQCMKIIANIIDTIPDNIFNNEKKYNFLQTKYNLLDLILDDLRRYMGKSVLIKYAILHNIPIKENNINSSYNNTDIFQNTYEGFYNHKINVELRLNFIKYIFPLLKEFSDRDLSFQLEKFWDIFFDMEFYKALISNSLQGSNKQNFKIDVNKKNSEPILMEIEETSNLQLDLFSPLKNENVENFLISQEEINLFFNIFNDNNDGTMSKFVMNNARYLMKNILTNPKKFNPKFINIIGFRIFSKFFYYLNLIDNKLYQLSGKFFTKQVEISYLDAVWNLLIKTLNPEVRNEAASLIVNCCLNLQNYNSEFANKIWSNFISKLLYFFSDSMEKLNSNKNNNNNSFYGVKAVLLLIKKILEKIDENYIPSSDEVFFNDNGYEVTFRINTNKSQFKSIRIEKEEYVYDIRAKISYIFDIPMMILGLKRKNILLTCNNDDESVLNFFERNSVWDIISVHNPILKINENPRNLILENSFIFNSLYSILKFENFEFINDAWELINIMPKNKELENKIFNLGKNILTNPEKTFLESFDISSIYHLNYSMQILKDFIEKDGKGNTNNNMAINSWMENFRKNNAAIFFINLLSELKYNNINDEIEYEKNLSFSTFYLQSIIDILWILENLFNFEKEKSFNCNNTGSSFYSSKSFTERKNNIALSEENQNKLIQSLFKIIYEILISSYNTDNNPKFIELQNDYIKKKLKEIELMKTRNPNNLNNKIDKYIMEINKLDMDNIQEEIRFMWNQEDKVISQICKFFDNKNIFNKENVSKNILKCFQIENNKCPNDKTFNENDNFSLIIKKGLILPKNFKAKFTLWEFVESIFFKGINEEKEVENSKLCYCYLYNNIFSKDMLLSCVNNSESLKSLSVILKKIFEANLITEDFIKKNNNYLSVDFKKLIEFVLNLIKNLDEYKDKENNSKNEENNSENDDIVYEYLFSILRELTLHNRELKRTLLDSKNILDYLINDCLFSKCILPSNSKDIKSTDKIINKKSSVFGLLSSLCYDNINNIRSIIKLLTDYHKLGFWRSKRNSDWNKFASMDQKSSTGLVGLENLGCTCYMNSLLQQFFNIAIIREGILATADNQLQTKDESYLYQIKKIFGFLKNTDRKYHNPKDFTNIFKNYDGQVMNVTEQMDIDEFYNLLIDRLEPYLKSTKFENLFKYIFSGTLSNEIIGKKDCQHHSETKEVFQSIILQVKNKKNIEESLEAFIQGEMMEGENSYNCEKCEKKVSALKRQCFKKLPNVLVLVLKRFEYDYDTMQKNKINDYCEFPLELNMEKYCQEYLNSNNSTINNYDSSYSYDLTGIVIHSGTTERGHYYSFAKKDNKNWYDFNDHNVSNFDIDDIEHEAFGGNLIHFNTKSGKNELIEKSTNAYVLFYTKKDAIKLEEEYKNKMDLEINDNKNNNEEYIFNSLLKNKDNNQNIQNDIIENIKTDNFQYWVSKAIFSNEYNNFIKDLMINYNSSLTQIYNFGLFAKSKYSYLENMKNYSLSAMENIFDQHKNYNNNKETNNNYNHLTYQLNYGFSDKKDNYIFDKVRIHRFKKGIFNSEKINNNNIDTWDSNFISEGDAQNQKDNEIYLKKILNIYEKNSNIDKDLIIPTNNDNLDYFSNINDFNVNIPNEREPCSPNQLDNGSQKARDIIEESENSIRNKSLILKHLPDIKNFIKNDELSNEMFKFCVIFFFTNSLRLRDKNQVYLFSDIIKTHINLNTNNANWLLEEFSNCELINEFLVESTQNEMKRITAGILYTCLLKASNDPNESSNDTIENFMATLLFLISKKTKNQNYANKDFNNIYYLVWRYSGVGKKQKEFLYKLGLVKYILIFIRTKYKIKSDINLEDCIKLNLRIPAHNEMVNKNPIVLGKLSLIEEMLEKRQLERNSSSSDSYLIMSLFEILSESDYVDKCLIYNSENSSGSTKMHIEDNVTSEKIILSREIVNLLNLENKDNLKLYAMESNRNRVSMVYFINLLNKFCFNNEEYSNKIFESFYENFSNLDADEISQLLRVFRGFIGLNDDLAEIRAKIYFKKFMILITENFRFYKFTEVCINCVIDIFLVQSQTKRFLGHIEKYKEYIMKFYKWLKTNPISPQYINTKDTVMFKYKKNPGNNLSSQDIQQYQNVYMKLTEEQSNMLQKIFLANLKDVLEIPKKSNDGYKHDFIDFEFSKGDIVKIDINRIDCNVISVMDELIQIEFTSDANIQKKPTTIQKWIETEKVVEIVNLQNDGN